MTRMKSGVMTWRGAFASAESGLTPDARLVAFVLSIHMSEKGDSCYPPLEQQAQESGLNKRQVIAAQKELETGGWLFVKRTGGGRGRANEYESRIPKGFPMGTLLGHATQSETVPRRSINGAETVPPRTQQDVVQDVEPSQDARSRTAFDLFWDIYPKRNGKKLHRAKAEDQWARLSDAQRERAIRGAGYYAQAVTDEITIAADAFRWLRDRAFEDWQTPAVPDRPRRNGSGSGPINPNDSWGDVEATV